MHCLRCTYTSTQLNSIPRIVFANVPTNELKRARFVPLAAFEPCPGRGNTAGVGAMRMTPRFASRLASATAARLSCTTHTPLRTVQHRTVLCGRTLLRLLLHLLCILLVPLRVRYNVIIPTAVLALSMK